MSEKEVPVDAIDTLFKLKTSKKLLNSEKRKNLEQQIISYMNSKNVTSLEMEDKDVVCYDETKQAVAIITVKVPKL